MAAEPIAIQGSPEEAKIRTPINVVVLTIVTLGIYGIVWYYKVNKEMAAVGQVKGTDELGTNPTNSLLALFPGGLIIVPALISIWNFTKRVDAGRRLSGGDGLEPPLLFLIYIFISPIAIYLVQKDWNGVLEAQAGGAAPPPPAAAAPGGPEAPVA